MVQQQQQNIYSPHSETAGVKGINSQTLPEISIVDLGCFYITQ